jgi:hypothetical protein
MNINNISLSPNIATTSPSEGQARALVTRNLLGTFEDEDSQSIQLQVSDAARAFLAEVVKTIGQYDALLQSLPNEVKEEILTIFKENTAGTDEVGQGLTAMFKSQKQTADKLTTMSETLRSAMLWQQEEKFSSQLTDKSLLFVTKNLEPSAQIQTLSESDILQLAEQLLLGENSGDEEQPLVLAKQLLQQFFTNKDIRVMAKDMAGLYKLFSSLEQHIPQNVQQAAAKYHLPELADAYVFLNLRNNLSQKELPISNRLLEMMDSMVTNQQEKLINTSLLSGLTDFESLVSGKSWTSGDIILLASKLLSGNSSEGKEQFIDLAKQLLQPFFTGKDVEHLIKEMTNFRNLFSSLEQQIPQSVQQAAVLYRLPQMTDAYVLLKLQEIMQWKDMQSNDLRECSEKLRTLSIAMQKNMTSNSGEIASNQTIATFSMPIYFDGGSQSYPLYIHIYTDHDKKNESSLHKEKEVWMRVSLATENIGMVDVLLHFYGENQLNLKVDFSNNDYAKSFLEYVPAIKSSIDCFSITLANINIRSITNK